MQIIEVSPKDLKPHKKNPRVHPESAIEKLMQSIKTYGWTNPIIATEDLVILAGHARQKAALKLGLKTVPVVTVPISGEDIEAYMVADNRTQEETFWDEAELRLLMVDLQKTIPMEDDLSITATGFELDEVEVMNSLFELDKEIRRGLDQQAQAQSGTLATGIYICPRCGHENKRSPLANEDN